MSDSKRLIIGTAFDSKGLDAATKALKNLQKEGLKIGNILKDLDLTTGAGRGRFAKSIITTEKQMGKLGGTTKQTADVMKNVYGRQLDMESKRLDRVTSQLTRLNKLRNDQKAAYENLQKSGATNEASAMRMRMGRTEDAIVQSEGVRRVRQKNLEELQKPQGMSTQDKLLIGQAVASAMAGMASQFQGMKNQGWQNMATTAGVGGGVMRQFYGGNFGLSDALTHGRRDFMGNLLKGSGAVASADGKGLAKLENIAQGADKALGAASGGAALGAGGGAGGGGGAKDFAAGNNIGGILNNTGGVVHAGANGFMGGPEATEAQSIDQRLQLLQQNDPFRQLVYDNLAATARSRLSASRRLGGKHLGIAALGAGYGDSLPEALASATGMAEQFGAGEVNHGLFRRSLQMETHGFDRMKSAQMLGTISPAVGRSESGKQLEEIFARGIKRGMGPENVQYFEAIGKSVAEHAFGTGGAVNSVSGYGQALSNGLGANSSMHDVMRNISGANALDGLNQNGYFRAINLENAKKQLGGSQSWAGTQALGDAGWSDLMGGNREMSAFGISDDDRKNQMRRRIEALKVTAGVKAGMSKQRAAAQLYETLKGSPGGFGSYDEALGALNFLDGSQQDMEQGHLGKGFGDGNAFSQLSTQARIQNTVLKGEKGIVSKDVFDNADRFFEGLTKVQPGLAAATDALNALKDVYDVLEKIAKVAPAAAKQIAKEHVVKTGR